MSRSPSPEFCRTDVREKLDRLSHSAGLSPVDVIREAASKIYLPVISEDRQAAHQITPRKAELKVILARNLRPGRWHDPDEPLH